MKIGFNGATSMKHDLESDIAHAAKAGFGGVEIWGAKLTQFLKKNSAGALKEIFAKERVDALTINSLENATLAEGSRWEETQKRMAELSKLAVASGASTVIVVPSPLTGEWKGADRERIAAKSVESLRRLAEIAQGEGARASFEMLGFDDCSVNKLDFAWRLVKEADRPNLGLTVDTFHWFVGGSTTEMLEKVPKDKLYIVHVNDAEHRASSELQDRHRLFPGEGSIPLDRFFASLGKMGYDGPVSIELFRPEYWEWTPEKIAKRSLESVKSVLAGAKAAAK